MSVEEQTLLAGLRQMDPQAITEIHRAYYALLYRYACYRLGDTSLAEDLTSETFIRLLDATAAGKGPRDSLHGWLMGTLSNQVNDHFRRAYNQPTEILGEQILDRQANPSQHVEQQERNQVLRQALAALTPEQQHVLALRFGLELSLQETADLMHKRVNAVKQLQFRALAALKRQIGEQLG